jgi:hypothetical protein
MNTQRKMVRVYEPKGAPGFLGNGHVARPVIQGGFAASDPFILLMDDMLDKKDNEPAGGPHPHAVFETVTLLLEGELGAGDHKMNTGDLQMMTAGSGVVHTETIDKAVKMRILQLWLSLPRKDRWATPRVQDIPLAHVPAMAENGISIKLYSGSLAGLTSPMLNYTPLIIADITIEPGTTHALQLPGNYNAFMYVLQGSMMAGDDKQMMRHDQVGWLNILDENVDSDLTLTAGDNGSRFVLYAGLPTGDAIASHGPFIADSEDDMPRLFREYRQGKMPYINTVPAAQQIKW